MTATLTPVSGPLAGRPDIIVKVTDAAGQSGKLSFTMPSGEHVTGKYTTIPGQPVQGVATAHGDRGSVFDMQFTTNLFGKGFGEATDNHGNKYRLIIAG